MPTPLYFYDGVGHLTARVQVRVVELFAPQYGHHYLIFPPRSARWRSHPTYCLLGFSAALAPKFPPWAGTRTASFENNSGAYLPMMP